ncbi:MAG: hypothetical protein HC802_16295 [Caldilineaceae bacterium]|nr:hypothetical protein [Caldilineaceae bacterium]
MGEETVRRAVGDALLRLQAGESELAIHPNCGTNLATTAVLTTVAALIGGSGQRRGGIERFTTMLLLILAALVAARPLGFRLQAYTTSAAVSDRWVAEIRSFSLGSGQGYRVLFD